MFMEFFVIHGRLCDTETLHRKFGIIHNCMDEMFTNLYQSLMDANFINDNLDMSRLVNFSRPDVLGQDSLSFIINSFEKCSLRKNVEPIINLLWRLFYSILSQEGKLKGWRDLVDEEKRNWPNNQKLQFCNPRS